MENSENVETNAETIVMNQISTAVFTSISLDISDDYINRMDQEFENASQTNTKELEETEVEVDSIENILKSWNMFEELGQLFREHQMDKECLVHIKESDVDQLLPIFRTRIKFKNHLVQWRIANGYSAVPISEMLSVVPNASGLRSNCAAISTSPSPSPPTPAEENEIKFETKHLLNLNLCEILEGDYLDSTGPRIHKMIGDLIPENDEV